MRPVGILGGMGPEATILLQQRLLALTPARDDSDHVPLMIDMNPQVPSRIAYLVEGTGPSPGPTLAAMARRLEAMGATALAMPCNTAHHFTDEIRGAVSIPLLDIVDLAATACSAAAERGEPIGMLASPAVRTTRLFDRALDERSLTPVWPDDPAGLLASIRAIKAEGMTGEAICGVLAASGNLLAKGCRVQLIACTEFSLARDRLPEGVVVVDAVDALAAAILRHATDVP